MDFLSHEWNLKMYLAACKFPVTPAVRWTAPKKCTSPSLPRNTCQIVKHSCTLHEAYGLRTLFVHTTWHINGHKEERSKTQRYLPAHRRPKLLLWGVILLIFMQTFRDLVTAIASRYMMREFQYAKHNSSLSAFGGVMLHVKYMWNNSYLYCSSRWKWSVIIAVIFPI